MNLYFNPTKVPRTTKRDDWYRTWREVRLLRKELKLHDDSRIQQLRNPLLPNQIKEHIVNELIYPPLLLGPFMEDAL